MIIVGIIRSVFGIGFFCWLLFTLAVYADTSVTKGQSVAPSTTTTARQRI